MAMTANNTRVQLVGLFINLFMAFQDAYVSIHIFSFDFWASGSDAAPRKPVGAIDELAVVTFRAHVLRRQRGHRKIAEDAAVEVLETEVRGKPVREGQLDPAIDGGKIGVLLRVLAKYNFHAAVHGVRGSFAPTHLFEVNGAVHVVDRKISGHTAHVDVARVHSLQLQIDVAG